MALRVAASRDGVFSTNFPSTSVTSDPCLLDMRMMHFACKGATDDSSTAHVESFVLI